MKINYYEAFDLIGEDVVDILSSYEQNDFHQITSEKATIEGVFSLMDNTQKIRHIKSKKTKWTIRLLVAVLIIGTASITAFAIREHLLLKDGSAEIISDSTRKYIGKESHGEATIMDADGNIVSSPNGQDSAAQSNEKSSLITSIQDNNTSLPKTMTEIVVTLENDVYTTPEVIFPNNAMIIFCKENGDGWDLQKGDKLIFKAEEYPSEVTHGKGQAISYLYIRNGKLMNRELSGEKTLNQHYELTAEKKGEYFLCLIGASSDPIALKSGVISQKGTGTD